MPSTKSRGQMIRDFILKNIIEHPSDIASKTASQFDISRQAVSKHMRKLVDKGVLSAKGSTRNRTYALQATELSLTYSLKDPIQEDIIWRDEVAPFLDGLPDNVMRIWNHGVTEMINNVIDHSEGSTLKIRCNRNKMESSITVMDNGVGIFKKIKDALDLEDEKLALLELSKGKLTTMPEQHSGERIFFTYGASEKPLHCE